jgi:NTE family protein
MSRQARTVWLLCLFLALGASTAASPADAARPRIGLALGGGSAKGLAHIGVLRWFEEHRIPVDMVSGTSMGGLVGGAYATGMTPAELALLMKTTDWDVMFLSDTPFKYKTFRRKQDSRASPAQLELGPPPVCRCRRCAEQAVAPFTSRRTCRSS